MEPDEGTIKWGVSTSQAYFPKDNTEYFNSNELGIMDWMRQFSEDKRESYLRTFLGRMLFSGDDVYKAVKVLSGGEKVRLASRRGEVEVAVQISDRVTPGLVFTSFHYPAVAINKLTNPARDPIAKIPEYKVCAVRVEKIEAAAMEKVV